jgi:hypothetical protein
MVVFVSIDALDCVVLLEVVLHQEFKDLCVDGDLGKPNEDTS